MAGVGDKIDAHAFDAAQFAEITQRQNHGWLEPRAINRRRVDLKISFDRDTFEPGHAFRNARSARAFDRIEHVGRTQTTGQKLVEPQRRKIVCCGRIDRHDAVASIDRHDRVGQGIDEVAEDHPVAVEPFDFHATPKSQMRRFIFIR